VLVQIPLDQNLLSKWWLLEGTGALTRSRKEEWWFRLSTETRQHINRWFNSGQRWTLLLDKYTGPLSVVLIILLECTLTSWPHHSHFYLWDWSSRHHLKSDAVPKFHYAPPNIVSQTPHRPPTLAVILVLSWAQRGVFPILGCHSVLLLGQKLNIESWLTLNCYVSQVWSTK